MLCKEPWCDMLPEGVDKAEISRLASEASLVTSTAPPANAEELLSIAQQIFDKTDTDGNGKIDPAELEQMVFNFYGRVSNVAAAQVHATVEQIMQEFDENKDGFISFPEFMKLL